MADPNVLDDILSQLSTTSPSVGGPTLGSPTQPHTQPVSTGSATPPNSQQSLRDKMKASNAQPGKSVVLEQTDNYQEEGMGSNATSTVIEADDGDDEDVKKGVNIKLIVGVGIAVLIVLAVFAVQMFKKPPVEEQVIQPLPEEELVFLDPITNYTPTGYTADEINTLRGAGLTGTEIESYQNQGVPYTTAYNITKEQFWAWQLAEQLPITDMTSDAFINEVSKTWLTLPERHDLEEWTEENIAYNYTITKNLDYEKVDVHGNQLFLKVYLDDNRHEKWFFLNVTPQEWMLLEERGNVVVEYSYTTHFKPYVNLFEAEEDLEDIFITAAKLNIITDDNNGGF